MAIQYLPPRQRAVLILCDVLDWTANETAALLDLSTASVTSALQRARATLRERSPALRPPSPPDDERRRALLRGYVDATERGDVAGLAALLREDLRWSMPPEAGIFVGRETVVASWVKGGFGTAAFGALRCVLTETNRMPAVACYVRKPGEPEHRPLAIDVLQIQGGAIAEIVTFPLEGRTEVFGLPPVL